MIYLGKNSNSGKKTIKKNKGKSINTSNMNTNATGVEDIASRYMTNLNNSHCVNNTVL